MKIKKYKKVAVVNSQQFNMNKRKSIYNFMDRVDEADSINNNIIKGGVMPNTHNLNNVFSYHAPKGDQTERYEKIRNQAKKLAEVVLECTPGSADQTAAIRKIREAVMTANASIAINE